MPVLSVAAQQAAGAADLADVDAVAEWLAAGESCEAIEYVFGVLLCASGAGGPGCDETARRAAALAVKVHPSEWTAGRLRRLLSVAADRSAAPPVRPGSGELALFGSQALPAVRSGRRTSRR